MQDTMKAQRMARRASGILLEFSETWRHAGDLEAYLLSLLGSLPQGSSWNPAPRPAALGHATHSPKAMGPASSVDIEESARANITGGSVRSSEPHGDANAELPGMATAMGIPSRMEAVSTFTPGTTGQR